MRHYDGARALQLLMEVRNNHDVIEATPSSAANLDSQIQRIADDVLDKAVMGKVLSTVNTVINVC